MWHFKKKDIDNYRICYLNEKYSIEKFNKTLNRYESLHYYPNLDAYEQWHHTESKYLVTFDSIKEARHKISTVIPQYYSAETPDPFSYDPL